MYAVFDTARNDVILYTDQDRKELTEGTDKYGKELVYLPDAVSANWEIMRHGAMPFISRC